MRFLLALDLIMSGIARFCHKACAYFLSVSDKTYAQALCQNRMNDGSAPRGFRPLVTGDGCHMWQPNPSGDPMTARHNSRAVIGHPWGNLAQTQASSTRT
jgi:hypothetical protein